MLVMSADHHVADPESFRRTVGAAAAWAASHDDLITLGVTPTRPETGYGYLRLGEPLGGGCVLVAAFVEKPVPGIGRVPLEQRDVRLARLGHP